MGLMESLELERQTANESLNSYYAQYDNLGGYLAPVEIKPEYAEKVRCIWQRYFCKPVRR